MNRFSDEGYDEDTVRAVFAHLGFRNPSSESVRQSMERVAMMQNEHTTEDYPEDTPEDSNAGDHNGGDDGEEEDWYASPEAGDSTDLTLSAQRDAEQQREVSSAHYHKQDDRHPVPVNAKASIETAESSGNLKSEQATRRSPLDPTTSAKLGRPSRAITPRVGRRDPLNTGERVYEHQKHYDGYLHLVRKLGEENIDIPLPTERTKEKLKSTAPLSARQYNQADPVRVAGLLRSQMTPTSSSVIYAAVSTGSGVRRSINSRCNGGATAGGRRANDPVSRGQWMRQQWQRDPFLTQKGRKDERWQVRQSMLGWSATE